MRRSSNSLFQRSHFLRGLSESPDVFFFLEEEEEEEEVEEGTELIVTVEIVGTAAEAASTTSDSLKLRLVEGDFLLNFF